MFHCLTWLNPTGALPDCCPECHSLEEYVDEILELSHVVPWNDGTLKVSLWWGLISFYWCLWENPVTHYPSSLIMPYGWVVSCLLWKNNFRVHSVFLKPPQSFSVFQSHQSQLQPQNSSPVNPLIRSNSWPNAVSELTAAASSELTVLFGMTTRFSLLSQSPLIQWAWLHQFPHGCSAHLAWIFCLQNTSKVSRSSGSTVPACAVDWIFDTCSPWDTC